MVRFLFATVILFSLQSFADNNFHYICVGDDPTYQVAALNQIVYQEGNQIISTFALEVGGASDQFMTRYNQKDDLLISLPDLIDDSLVVSGTFEKDGHEISIKIFHSWAKGYEMELSADNRTVRIPCRKKI